MYTAPEACLLYAPSPEHFINPKGQNLKTESYLDAHSIETLIIRIKIV